MTRNAPSRPCRTCFPTIPGSARQDWRRFVACFPLEELCRRRPSAVCSVSKPFLPARYQVGNRQGAEGMRWWRGNEHMDTAHSGSHEKYERLVSYAKTLPPVTAAVAHPCDQASMGAAFEAFELGLMAPILVGPRTRMQEAAKAAAV